ncbi:MAG TPA: hypothetical protein PK440_20640 [Candidatus Accumulibacter phosphatis]|nr:MAG: hypothetical protein AW07_03389 [Candidatus Accumulibacter sp. SK-11]HRL77959.1 hypothetical protein [Candidatus Accumulibacter phosphatis]HRQ97369.1 hypothetical protein [Candidatus Accumulibacter phosphatis]
MNAAWRRSLLQVLAATVAATALAACVSAPAAPDWQTSAHGALAGYSEAYLAGNTRLADGEFARAHRELARTGRPDLLARAELTRCALRVACLDVGPGDVCPGFSALIEGATADERAYADFLAGRPADPALLPASYRKLVVSDGRSLAAIESPVSRLIAAGVLLQQGKLSLPDVDLAVDTASAQGWRRPLLAWLDLQATLAEKRGDSAVARNARWRIELVSGQP